MTPAEIDAAIEAFNLLEPEVQKGIAALIHVLHKKPPTAQDFIDEATALLASNPEGLPPAPPPTAMSA
jgi:hypothetical protein